MKKKFDVQGMTCSACSSHVEKAVSKLDGVKSCAVSLMTNTMLVDYDDSSITADGIIDAVKKSGYGASLSDNEKSLDKTKKIESNSPIFKAEENALLTRVIASIVFMLVLMYVSMGHMVGLPLPSFLSGTANAVSFALVQLLLTLPVLYINRSYFIGGTKALIKRAPNMDTLIAIGSGASLIYGIVALFIMSYRLGAGDLNGVAEYYHQLYFESAVMILALVTLGKYLEGKSKRKTGEAINKLIDMSPKTANVIRDGVEMVISSENLVLGDIVAVRPGEAISADGSIIEGETYVDESAITGESKPARKGIGDDVVGGTINKSGFFKLKVTRVGADTTLNKIIELVENANATKAPISKIADRISGVFVPIVIAISIIAFIVWVSVKGDFEFAFSIAVAVLVISCPCALGLATPVAIMVGTGKGAEKGILIKSGEALELGGKIDTVALDKTGTITTGKPTVTDIIAYDFDRDKLLKLTASSERFSEHPLAQAIVESFGEIGSDYMDTTEFTAIEGRGISALIDGKKVFIGNSKLMADNEINIDNLVDAKAISNKDINGNDNDNYSSESPRKTAELLSSRAATPMFVAYDDRLVGIISVSDAIREDSKEAILELESLGIEIIMLTGDNELTARAIADQVGIANVVAGVLPDGKESVIRELQDKGRRVAFVGDGVNDAPSLARADVGVAIGAGTDIAVESADVVLVKNSLKDVAALIRLSRATIRNVKENLFWAFIYNTLGIPLAAGIFYPWLGWRLSPMLGALAMSLSSVCVVLNALRLKLFNPNKVKRNNLNKMKSSFNSIEINDTKEPNETLKTDTDANTAASIKNEAYAVDCKSNNNQERDCGQCKIKDNLPCESDKNMTTIKSNSNLIKENIEMGVTIEVVIDGMSCGHCSARVEKALNAIDGISAHVDLDNKTAYIENGNTVKDEEIIRAVKDAGYEVVGIKR